MEELSFFDAGPKPDWAPQEPKPPAPAFPPPAGRAGPAAFLRPGGPIRSRLVGDGALPEELPMPARHDPMAGVGGVGGGGPGGGAGF